MTSNDIARYRLNAQHIATADFTRPEEVVRHLVALQAQDYNGALWSIGLRTKNCTKAAIEQAIIERKIIRTWPMRGTLHCLHADDARWMVELLGPRATKAAKGRRLALGLSDKVMQEVEDIIRSELAGGKVMRRDTLQQLLTAQIKNIEVGTQQFGHILRNFGERGILCFGPHDGKQPTFVLLDEWLPNAPTKHRDEALAELARRYYTSHGPATLHDFAGWGYLTMGDARKALNSVVADLETAEVSGTTYYYASGVEPAKNPSAFLLPSFDEYMLGYKGRTAALPSEHSEKIVPGKNGMFLPTVVINGQVVGTWKGKYTRGSVSIATFPFGRAIAQSAALKHAERRYKTFLGM